MPGRRKPRLYVVVDRDGNEVAGSEDVQGLIARADEVGGDIVAPEGEVVYSSTDQPTDDVDMGPSPDNSQEGTG